MHLAVLYQKHKVIDWIVGKEEGRLSLDMLNHDGFTPLTLAARHGLVDTFQHILSRHMSVRSWQYGEVIGLK